MKANHLLHQSGSIRIFRIPLLYACIIALFVFASNPVLAATPSPSGTPAAGAQLPGIQTVFLIVMENQDWSAVKDAPYIHSLTQIGAHAEQYYNPPRLHPSEPNYIWLEAGTNCFDGKCYTSDDDVSTSNHITTTAHLVSQLKDAGITWKAYLEGISGQGCPTTSHDRYTARHVGMIFFDDVWNAGGTTCETHLRPYSELERDLAANSVARYNLIVPDVCHDMHDCSIADGDRWLSQELPKIMASAAYQASGAIFLTWDEGAADRDGPLGMIVLSPKAKVGYTNSIHYTHSSTLRTLQEIFGVGPLLGDAANAPDLGDLFVKP
jgi:phosphatidylinositol-3-phosphatase